MRYGTFLYGTGVLYGASTDSNLSWAIQIDWDGDGVFDGSNDGLNAVDLEVERGRDRFLNFSGNEIQFPTVGRAVITLDNTDQRYNAWNTSSPLYGYIEPGKFVKIWNRIGTTGTDYPVMTGTIKDIQATGRRNELVKITVEDGLQWLYDNTIDIDVQQSIRVDEAIQQVLDAVAWPTMWGSDLDISSDTLTFWWSQATGAREISDLAQTGLGYFSIAADGAATFRSRSSVGTTAANLTDDNTLNQVILAQPWENYKNIVRVRFFPRVQQANGVVYKLNTIPQLGAGATLTIFGDYSYGTETRIPALNAAIASSDYSANSQADGLGTDLTANMSVTLTDFGTNAKIEVTNTGGSPFYITLLQVTGDAITVPNPGAVEEQVADFTTKPRRFTLSLPWQQDTNAAGDIATVLAEFLSALSPYPVVQVETRPDVQFAPDLFQAVQYSSNYLGISDSFRVGKIEHKWLSPNGQSVRTTFRLEPYITGAIAWVFPVTDFGNSGTGGTTFG